MAKKEESLIHLRFNISEAKKAKKDLLEMQLNTLQIATSLANYKKLRLQELRKKERLGLKLKSLRSDLNRLNRILPKIKIPKILQHEENSSVAVKKVLRTSPEIKKYGTIEDQLKKIQAKLKALE